MHNTEWSAALGISALLTIIMLTSQSASANMIGGFDCFGESECVSGWNDALSQAQTDWNSGQYTQIQNGGNPDCFTGHTQAYCNGYTKGYTYEWNTLYQWQSSQSKQTSPSLPPFELCYKGRCTPMGTDTCRMMANGSCVPTSASNMTGAGGYTTTENTTNFLKYENSTYGIKMQYPSDWRVEGASSSSIVASFYPQRDYASYVTVQIENLTTGFTPDQYLASLMLGDAADYKDFPDIRFNQNTTNNIVLAGHPRYLLNGTFRDPTSDALQRFTNIGTIIGDKVYSIIYYSPAETYPVYRTIYLQMIKSFEIRPHFTSYQNTAYGIQIRYPSDWTIQESNASGTLINIATFVSPTGPNSNPTADVSIYMDKLHNSTTTLNNYAHFVAFTDYENKTSYFRAFKLLELSTNSTLAGKPAYTLIGTYQNPSAGLQKLMEVGTIIGDKAYSVQYIADAPKYSDYLSIVQKMIDSLVINISTGTGIGLIADNSTNLYPDNWKSVTNYVMSCGLGT